MDERKARELVVEAGISLVKEGLIARTWGNVSCRVDENTFAITPSGRSYETLKPEEIVLCKVEDASYTGEIKPSSERGIHALVYRTKPQANFVIHTHQTQASAVSVFGLDAIPAEGTPLLGKKIPVAKYGLPGTKTLRKNIGLVLPESESAVVMAHHGALCYGEDREKTFSVAQALEEACRAYILKALKSKKGAKADSMQEFAQSIANLPEQPVCYGDSRRTKSGFVLTEGGSETQYRLDGQSLSGNAAIHAGIYRAKRDVAYIVQSTEPPLLAASVSEGLAPLLDDFAQLVGRTARLARDTAPGAVVKALSGRTGVLVPGGGALCCAGSLSDAQAVGMVMEKNAYAQQAAGLVGGGKQLSLFDCKLMNAVYRLSYSKKK